MMGGIIAGAVWLLRRFGVVGPAPELPDAASSPADPTSPVEAFAKSTDVLASMAPVACLSPQARPGIEAFRAYVLRTYGGTDLGIWRGCTTGGASEHKIGRAWDWGTTPAAGVAPKCIAWLEANNWEMARRLGIGIIIWDRRIWSAWLSAQGWRAYTGPSPHTDHVHFSFSEAGARGELSGFPLLRDSSA